MTGDRSRKTAERDLTAQCVRAAWGILALAAVMLLGGCTGGPSPSPTSTLTPSASPSEPVTPTPTSPTLSPEPTAAPITPPPPGPSCEADWTTAPQAATQASTARVTGVRVGRHDCFDRLVIDLDRSAPGYEVRYVSAVSEEGSGRMLSLAGSAFLSVVVLAPAYDIETGKETYFPADRNKVADVSGFEVFRQFGWVGSFEGRTVLGVGVEGKRPFRALTLPGPGSGSRVVLDVLH